jgi:hypothetical protein
MSFNGSGVYTLPGAQLANGEVVSATENNQFRNDVATALNTCWTRDGQAPATANIPMGSHKLTGLSDGSVTGDSIHFGQIGVAVQAYDADISTVAASQAEMEAGTETALRSMSPLRVAQAISALSPAPATIIPSGTLMLFQQTNAPTGWTKQTTHNDKALRVVSGTASSGGTTAFSTVFANQTPTITLSGLTAAATTLSTSQIPSHTHPLSGQYVSGNQLGGVVGGPNDGNAYNATGAEGGGGSHTHSVSGSASSSAITLNVQYVDLIICQKN